MIRSLLLLVLTLFFANTRAFQSRLPTALATHTISTPYSNHEVKQQSTASFLVPESSMAAFSSEASSLIVSAVTLDPTAFFTNLLAGFLGSPLILAVPILAAFSVVAVMAAIIIGYASPAADDD